MWFYAAPGGVPVPLAVGREAPPEGQTLIDGLELSAWSEEIELIPLVPDNTRAMRMLVGLAQWMGLGDG